MGKGHWRKEQKSVKRSIKDRRAKKNELIRQLREKVSRVCRMSHDGIAAELKGLDEGDPKWYIAKHATEEGVIEAWQPIDAPGELKPRIRPWKKHKTASLVEMLDGRWEPNKPKSAVDALADLAR